MVCATRSRLVPGSVFVWQEVLPRSVFLLQEVWVRVLCYRKYYAEWRLCYSTCYEEVCLCVCGAGRGLCSRRSWISPKPTRAGTTGPSTWCWRPHARRLSCEIMHTDTHADQRTHTNRHARTHCTIYKNLQKVLRPTVLLHLPRAMMMTACDLSAIAKPWEIQSKVHHDEWWSGVH